MIKQAIILAAGNGSRMKNGSDNIEIQALPKPLLSVNGETLIEKKLKILKKNNFDVCIVINPNMEKFFRQKLADYDVEYSYQPEPKGVANAVYCARDFIKEDLFLLLMGDDIINYDIKKVLKIDKPTVFGFNVEDVNGYGALILDKQGYITNIIEKELSGKGIVNTGVYVIPKEFFDVYNDIKLDPKSKEYYLFSAIPLLSKRGIKFSVEMLDDWFGVNTPIDLEEAKKRFKYSNIIEAVARPVI
jgi:dTDP-glucose pyrophosphorylase